MKKRLLFLGFLFYCIIVQAQYSCYEPDSITPMRTDPCERTLPEDWDDVALLASSFIPDENTPIIIIPVNVNVWREDDGTGNWWLDTQDRRDSLQKAYDYLNDIYSHNEPYSLYIPNTQFIEDTRVRFVIDTVYYYNNSVMAYKKSTSDFTNYLLANYPERLNKFNYHLSLDTTANYSGCSNGYGVPYPAIVSVKQNIYKPRHLYSFAMHMAHEFGHNFGLNHTYNGEYTVIAHPEFLWDVFGTETQSWCNQPPTKVCYHDGGWSCNPTDSTNTCTNNIMGGTYMSRHFSALQCGRIHRALQVTPLKNYAYGDTTSELLHLSSNHNINYNRKLYQSLVIDSGITLNVTCRLEMSPSTCILIRPGGKLIVDGGTITSAGTGAMWQGIEVAGDRTKHQEPQYQGVVELRNGAVIENAVTAIRTGERGNDWSTAGGIIQATDAVFRNNQRAVEFLSYCDTVSNTSLRDNCSFFTRCVFTIDTGNLLAQNNLQFYNHVTLWDVKNVKFKGCTFENNMHLGKLCEGKGLYSVDAGFSLTTDPFVYATYSGGGSFFPDTFSFNTFYGFNTAVDVTTSGSQYAIKMDEAKFNNNQQAVAVDGNNHVVITRCDFNQTDYKALQPYQRKGISLNCCTGYHIEENLFYDYYHIHNTLTNNLFGIKISESGTNSNKIYRNTFNKLANGILISGTNGSTRGGLQFLCNSFSNSDYDVRLMPSTVVSPVQGTLAAGADNSFSATYNYDIYNGGGSFLTYLYSSSNSAHYPSQTYQVVSSSQGVSSNPCLTTIFDLEPRADYNTEELAAMVSSYLEMDSARLSQWEMTEENTYNTPDVTLEMMALQQEASELYYGIVRQIMFDSLTDLMTLAEWHSSASIFADPYSLSETQYQMDETADYANITIDNSDERENYIAFRNLKAECAAQTTERGVNWYALSDRQIEELMRIAERNTGRSSVMAKGILCFFYKICYENEEENIDTRSIMNQNVDNLPIDEFRGRDMDTKEDNVQEEQNIATISLYPNPAKQTVTILFSENQEIVNKVMFVNMQGVTVLSEEKPNRNTIDISNLPVGMYVVRVFSQSGKTYSVKLVKE